MENIKEYSNGDLTIVWQHEKCIHSGICARGLPDVFQPRVKPWVKPDAATTETLMAQVDKCPSGALSYYLNTQKPKNE